MGHVLACGAGGSLKSLQANWPNKMGTKAATPWSSLAKLSAPSCPHVFPLSSRLHDKWGTVRVSSEARS